jgi:outer membrane protein assembly factor BamB
MSGMTPVLGLLMSASASAADRPPGVRVAREEGTAAAAPSTARVTPLAPDESPFGPVFSAFGAPPLTSGFAGLGDLNIANPSNTHGAAGSNYLMETLSSQVRVQNTAGAVAFGPLSLNAFWSTVNSNGTGAEDPRVVYDPFANRWIVVSCDEVGSPSAKLLVGVSRTAIPDLAALNWHKKDIDVDAGATLWARSPTVGFSNRWVVVQVNLFRISDNLFDHSQIYVFDKAQMYAGNLNAYTLMDLAATYRGTQVPATTYDTGVDDVYLLQTWDSAAGELRLYRITGSVATPTLETIGYPAQGAWIDTPGDINFAEQSQGPPGCQYCPSPPCKIRTDDSRVQNVVYRNGKLWATQTVVLPAPLRASVQWWQIRTDATVAQQGLIDDPFGQRFFAFPSIAVNKNDDVLLGYSRFQGDSFAGASYSFRTTIDAPNTMQSESLLKDGEACYYRDFSSGKNLWGHYSATAVDPSDDLKMWTLQTYAAPPNVTYFDPQQRDRWGTWWGMVDPTPVIAITNPILPSEGDSGTTSLTFDVSLRTVDLLQPLPTSQTVTVDWATADGTAAVADGDYVAASGTLVFAPGETAKTVTVAVKGDLKREPAETFFVYYSLVAPGNATMPDSQAVGTIPNDDPDPLISISDKQVVEGNPPGTTPAVFLVTLSNPSATTVTVQCSAAPGTAASPGDFTFTPGTVSFSPGEVEKLVTVDVVRDTMGELDETFFVNLSSASGGTLLKLQGAGVILDDDALKPPVIGLTAVSDDQRVRLQWQNPTWSVPPNGIVVRYNAASGGCAPPATPTDGSPLPVPLGISGEVRRGGDAHSPLVNGWEYCYTVFVDYGGGPPGVSSGMSVKATPFLPGKVKWKYFTGIGATSVAPPTVGQDGALMPSNDNFVHGMTRGATGGTWPTTWTPVNLGSPVQTRSPIVPYAGGSRFFVTTFDGWVHAIDAKTGAKLWETRIGTEAGAAPAGIFVAWGGAHDYVLVGTRQLSNNRFYALDPGNGAVIDYFPRTGDTHGISALGPVTGMATVDYFRGQVYFAAHLAPIYSLWCLKLGPPSDALQFGWATPRTTLGNIDGSPVLRGNRLYVGNDGGRLWAVDPEDGDALYYHDTGDANVKGFPFPDRRNGDVYFVTGIDASTGRVVKVNDTMAGFVPQWSKIAQRPSTPLLSTATDFLYVGVERVGTGAGVLQYTLGDGSISNPFDLEANPMVIGAPSLDLGTSPNMLYVGSEAHGVIYAVEVPF